MLAAFNKILYKVIKTNKCTFKKEKCDEYNYVSKI